MLKKGKLFILILISTLLAQLFLPWWIIALISCIVCLIMRPSHATAFFTAFSAVTLLWTYKILTSELLFDNSIIEIVGNIFGGLSKQLTVTIASSLGGIVSGLGALCGSMISNLVFVNKK